MTTTSIRRYRTKFIAALFLIAAFGVAGCHGGSPENAANEYLNALKIHNYDACYKMLSHEDQVDRTIEQFLAEIPMAPDVSKDWFKPILVTYKFDIGDSRMENGKANVAVKVTRPDLPLWERTIDAQLAGDTNPNDTPEQVAQKSLAEGKYPTVSYDDNMVFAKQAGEWRLVADFAFKERISKEHTDAVELYHQAQYDKAVAAYQKLLSELGMEEATGVDGLKYQYNQELIEIQRVQSEAAAALAYAPKIGFSDVALKMSASRKPGIFGSITNNSDRPIDQVTVTVSYYIGKGKNRKLAYSETHTPISTPLEFTDFARKVLPFVPGETRKFGFDLTAPIEIQQKADLDVTATGLVFTQSTAPLPRAPTPTPAATPTQTGVPAAPSPVPPAAH
ncbi:MAG TPA: hypothetical protein VMT58_00090 [Candidatus Binataceae bacterium]|nr:hypothetical protein [Candidatus Binataceae bacterium]